MPRDLDSITTALTVAGSDSGGGAGIQADLSAFRFFGVFGTCALTAVTAQNPASVTAVHPAPPDVVGAQIDAVFDAIEVRAAKTGMLFDSAVIEVVAERLAGRNVPLVVDPVMVAGSGARLLKGDAVDALVKRLLPLATVVTPNLPEAAVLVGRSVERWDARCAAAVEIGRRFGCAVVLKGGHGADPGVDVFWDGARLQRLATPSLETLDAHGTGCTFSAAIAAGLALGLDVTESVRRAKAFVFGCLDRMRRIGPDAYALWPPPTLPLGAVRLDVI